MSRAAAVAQRGSLRSRWTAALQRSWWARERTPCATLLTPLAWLFAFAAAVRRAAFRAGVLPVTRVRAPVIVVGSIVVGGSGKTPLVLALVEALRERGRVPGIVSRGYGRATRDVRAVDAGDEARDVGDEPLLLATAGVPVWIGARRAAAAQALLDAHAEIDVVVADDGLQHYALARDVEIAVVDAARGLGNRLLLPAGPLREAPSRLAWVDAVVRLETADTGRVAHRSMPARVNAHEFAMTQEPLGWVNLCDASRVFEESALADASSVAIAGIAHPDRFFDALRACGFRGRVQAFPDHHPYRREDVAFRDARAILMTQKDAVKCRAFADPRMWMLPIRACVDAALIERVLEKIDGSEASRNARLPGNERAARLRP